MKRNGELDDSLKKDFPNSGILFPLKLEYLVRLEVFSLSEQSFSVLISEVDRLFRIGSGCDVFEKSYDFRIKLQIFSNPDIECR